MENRDKVEEENNIALIWWFKLSKSDQKWYEMQTFGSGEFWEDNTLTKADITLMYKKYN